MWSHVQETIICARKMTYVIKNGEHAYDVTNFPNIIAMKIIYIDPVIS